MPEQITTAPTHPGSIYEDKLTLGFWIYMMTDFISFAALFATYAVLQGSTYGGPAGKELFNVPFVLIETMILLTSSFACGIAVHAAKQNKKTQSLLWLTTTFLLGVVFMIMELTEFTQLLSEGHGPQQSAFLSAFFTLIGTHGLHISVGLLWIAVLMVMIAKRGLTPAITGRLMRLGIFWHFLDVVWIFIFTIVYLLA